MYIYKRNSLTHHPNHPILYHRTIPLKVIMFLNISCKINVFINTFKSLRKFTS